MKEFVLHSQLAADCALVGDLPLSRVLLLNDGRYPWVVLVPRRADIREIYQLNPDDRQQLLAESCLAGEVLMRSFDGEKLNIGALGNMVPQLHVHHIVRRHDDPAWPGPVWGHSPAVAYQPQQLHERLTLLRGALGTVDIA
ncbi:HIT domain-containing protein [Thiosocius teredinicola]|uniref:HIT domain-containing protein n=1 Tax=Thiosocius teredinicola TaxID=1973002 RepID=UPI000990C90C